MGNNVETLSRPTHDFFGGHFTGTRLIECVFRYLQNEVCPYDMKITLNPYCTCK